MNRMLIGAFGALLLVAVGVFWWQGRAVESPAPPLPDAGQEAAEQSAEAPVELPGADIAGLQGPTLPEAEGPTREQERFFRYDRNRDGIITRDEMLMTRVAGFRRLDKDGNNLLTFEEWAVTTVDRFEGADGDGQLTAAEFATTAPRRRSRPTRSAGKCSC